MSDLLTPLFEAAIRPLLFPVLISERIFWLYLLGALVIALLVYIRKQQGKWTLKEFWAFCFPKEVYTHPSAINDYKFFFVNSIILALMIIPLAASISPMVSTQIQALLASQGVQPVINGNPVLFCLLYSLAVAMAIDLGIFIAHTLQHRIPFLWEFHKVHHSAEVLQPMTVYRIHPVDDLLNITLSATIAGVMDGILQSLMGPMFGVLSIFTLNIVIFGFYALGYNLRHSQIWVDYGPVLDHVFISPAQHQIHHSQAPKHFDKNMGFFFSFWDKLAGTLYVPSEEENLQYGLNAAGEHKQYSSVWTLYTLPFKRVFTQLETVKPVYWVLLLMLLFGGWMMGAQQKPVHKQSVYLEELTWTEVRDLVKSGYTTAIVPTGGTEQNGPHMVLGKHNYIVRRNAGRIAKLLGHTLVTPVMAYVPEGNSNPPTEHMRFSGTLTIPESTFEAVLESTARSLKTHGFKIICFVGDSGGNQKGQQAVADKLNREWKKDGVKVVHVGDYYAKNGQTQSLLRSGQFPSEIGTHAAIRDTSELMQVYPEGIRGDKLERGDESDYWEKGVDGNPAKASPNLGLNLLELKVRAAIRQIEKARHG